MSVLGTPFEKRGSPATTAEGIKSVNTPEQNTANWAKQKQIWCPGLDCKWHGDNLVIFDAGPEAGVNISDRCPRCGLKCIDSPPKMEANWKDQISPTEPLDPEVITLCDALNSAGFVTTQSCSGHGHQSLMVWFEHSTDERIESMARYVLTALPQPYSLRIRKQVFRDVGDYSWSIEVGHWGFHKDTLGEVGLGLVAEASDVTAKLIDEWLET